MAKFDLVLKDHVRRIDSGMHVLGQQKWNTEALSLFKYLFFVEHFILHYINVCLFWFYLVVEDFLFNSHLQICSKFEKQVIKLIYLFITNGISAVVFCYFLIQVQ